MQPHSAEVRGGIDPCLKVVDAIEIYLGVRLLIRLSDGVMNWHDDAWVDVVEQQKSPTIAVSFFLTIDNISTEN